MWYFSWILGLGFACSIGVMVGLWFELRASSASSIK